MPRGSVVQHFSEGNTTHSSNDIKMFSDGENKVKNIAHMFGVVKGEKKGVLSTPTKRKPEGEVGGGISSVLKIFAIKLSDELLYTGGGESPAKRQRCSNQLSRVSAIMD